MPLSTSPQTVYWLSRKRASSKQMKNWLLALLGSWVRAIEQTPRTCGSLLNSALRLGMSEPPVPRPGRIAALGHEAGDHAVERHAVVEAAAGELRDPLDVAGREVGAKLDDDVAAARKVEDKAFVVGHRIAPVKVESWRRFRRAKRVAPVRARQ